MTTSEEQALKFQESELKQELETINARVREKSTILTATLERKDKIENLTREYETLQARIDELKEFLAKAAVTLKDFPSDAQLQKLQTRLDSLNLDLATAEASVSTCKTGITAYEQRRTKNTELLLELSSAALTQLGLMEKQVKEQIEREETVLDQNIILKGCDEMSEIDLEREDRLQVELKGLEALLSEQRRQFAETVALQRDMEERFPLIEEEKERCLEEISMLWAAEREHLCAIYQRLLTLNMEQHHHLTRGTHIKRDNAPPAEQTAETLSMLQSRLTSEAIAASMRLGDLNEDINQEKIRCALTRDRGRSGGEQFQLEAAAKEDDLQKATEEYERVKEEAHELRNVKVELLHALQNLKDPKTIMMASTARTALSSARPGSYR